MPASRIDSRHLRYFVAVAEELNYRKAAERLHMAQPALTRQIQAMETAMGVQLFERIEGDHFTIMGLPLLAVLGSFRRLHALVD